LGLGLRSAGLSDAMVCGFACGTLLSRENFRTVLPDFQLMCRRLRLI
jgi:hypothetical protein